VVANDLTVDGDHQWWPRFCPDAVTAGYAAMMSIPLSTEGHRRAVLNLYAPDPGTFDTAAQATAGLFGAQAAIALYGARRAEGLERALQTRDVIGQAKAF